MEVCYALMAKESDCEVTLKFEENFDYYVESDLENFC